VLFRQVRPGWHEVPFTIVKFRTMSAVSDLEGTQLSDGARLDWFGRAVRASSMDELPELLNVLRGDMSLVGPRPLLTQYLPRYSNYQRRRHDVRPGITGLAQVHGRNALTWEKKFALDVDYVERCSFALDTRILLQTVWALFRRDGISQGGHATAAEFMGPNPS
jgi:sugar transferase EpsL